MSRWTTSSGGKGFYFSFDAMIAFTVIAASLAIVTQSSMLASDTFDVSTISYQKANLAGEDAMKLASRQDFKTFNNSFQQELVANTVMEEDDLDRNIVDGVTLLWAARNFSYASEVSERYFDGMIPEQYGYRLQVNNNGNNRIIYETSSTPANAQAVTSISRLVSGHQIDKPSEGFQARARAVEATTNQTKVVDIPMMGSGAYTNDLEINRSFYVPAKEIHESQLYLSMQWGVSNFASANVEINGEQAISESDMTIKEDGKAHYGFGKIDVADHVKPGWNQFTVTFPNQDSDYHAQFQPGTRIETVYSQDIDKVKDRDWEYLTDVLSEGSNANKRGGVWYNYPLQVPTEENVSEAVLQLDIRNLEDRRAEDLKIFVNDEKIVGRSAPVNDVVEVEFSDYLHEGTNVLSIYGNVELDGGDVSDFTHRGQNGPGPRIYANPQAEEGSRVKLSYDSPGGGLEYGLIELTWTKDIGTNLTESLGSRSNPAYFNHTYDEDFEIINSYLNPVQLNSINVTHKAGIGNLQEVYSSPRTYATPSKIETGEELVDGGKTTRYWYSDTCDDGTQRQHCELLPESGLQIELGIPSQVGYGGLFENETAAVNDANQRLEEQLGSFAEATEIEDDTISTGNQPYLWGPASVKLVVWNE